MKAQFKGKVYDGDVLLKDPNTNEVNTFNLSCEVPSFASLFIFANDEMFHFAILFENKTFELKLNGEVVAKRGVKDSLFMHNLPGGVNFHLTNSEAMKKTLEKYIFPLHLRTNPVKCLAPFKIIMDICQEENTKVFKFKKKELFNLPKDDFERSFDKVTNCKRFALRIWKESGLKIP